jgi:hypothetical protein
MDWKKETQDSSTVLGQFLKLHYWRENHLLVQYKLVSLSSRDIIEESKSLTCRLAVEILSIGYSPNEIKVVVLRWG